MIKRTKSSGNIFADLGLPNADERLRLAELDICLSTLTIRSLKDGIREGLKLAYICDTGVRQHKVWNYLYDTLSINSHKAVLLNKNQQYIKFTNGAIIELHNRETPETLRGTKFDKVIVDEQEI